MTSNGKWTAADVPDQSGRVAVVTGANTGIGYHTAEVLAERGAHVVLAVRNLEKGNLALARIVAAHPQADVTLQELDLSSLESVRAAATALRSAYPRIDLLINNAGVMWTPKQVTADGFEMQFGTNHLGHFALTGLLLDNLLPVRGSRVVTVSSMGHRIRAAIHFDDLQWEHRYDRVAAYGQVQTGQPAVHLRAAAPAGRPGAAHHRRLGRPPRHLEHRAGPQPARRFQTRRRACSARCCFRTRRWARYPRCGPPPTRTPKAGSTTDPTVLGEQRGHPKLVSSSEQSHDEDLQHRLWKVSEELTGVRYPV